jgi:hypothetical protein
VAILEVTTMDEDPHHELQKKLNTQKLEAAKKDLEGWRKILENGGYEVRPADPTFLERHSCRLLGENCESFDHGKCIFYSCNNKDSNYKKWRKHHERKHPEDDLRYDIRCKTCKKILEDEIKFMDTRIKEFETLHEGMVEENDRRS